MNGEAFEIVDLGLGLSLQDHGRRGWCQFGVPPGGVMDDHAADLANRLLDNPAGAPVLEVMFQGAVLKAVTEVWIALTGGDFQATVPLWRAVRLRGGEVIAFPRNRSGAWAYVAVEGGFEGERFLGSASAYARGRMGGIIQTGQRLAKAPGGAFRLPDGVAGRTVDRSEWRNYDKPPPLRVWPGPQWEDIGEAERVRFFSQVWTVSSRSDRTGYRLDGRALSVRLPELVSEPVLVGSIQVPPGGLPIVTMRDGPTVGGYPKIGLVEPSDLSWLAQCRPGTKICFQRASAPGRSDANPA